MIAWRIEHTSEHPESLRKSSEPTQGDENDCVLKKMWRSKIVSSILYATSHVVEGARNVADFATQTLYTSSQVLATGFSYTRGVLTGTRVLEIVLFPLILKDLFDHCSGWKQKVRGARIDSAIHIIGDLGLLGRSVTLFAIGLVSVGAASTRIMKTVAPMFFVTSVLSLALTLTNYRTCYKTRKLEKEFSKAANINSKVKETSQEEFQAAVAFIKCKGKDDKGIALVDQAFNCKQEALLKSLEKVQKEATKKIESVNKNEQLTGKQLLNKTLKSLKGHIRYTGSSSALSAIISTVGLIAGAVLLFSPIAPITYSVTGAIVGMQIIHLAYHKLVEYHYAKDIGLERSRIDWITC